MHVKGKRIVMTGGSGLLGSQLGPLLVNTNNVTTVGRTKPSWAGNHIHCAEEQFNTQSVKLSSVKVSINSIRLASFLAGLRFLGLTWMLRQKLSIISMSISCFILLLF